MGNVIKFKDILNGDYSTENDGEYEPKKYRLTDIDNPKGWDFSEIDMLGDMGFTIDNDYDMKITLEIPSLDLLDTHDDQEEIITYKTNEGYVLKTKERNYVFETFNDMLEFISK